MSELDIIVYTQAELDSALKNGFTAIGLCDNHFTLPAANVKYIGIGQVSAESDTYVNCEGFTPVIKNSIEKNLIKPFNESYAGYKNSSFNLNCFTSYGTSFSSSYNTSYVSSYISSFALSYRTSYGTSFVSSYISSCFSSYSAKYENISIAINGYGIDLI